MAGTFKIGCSKLALVLLCIVLPSFGNAQIHTIKPDEYNFLSPVHRSVVVLTPSLLEQGIAITKPTYSPSGTRIAFTVATKNLLVIKDKQSGKLIELSRAKGVGRLFAFSPDSQKIFTFSTKGMINSKTSILIFEPNPNARSHKPVVSYELPEPRLPTDAYWRDRERIRLEFVDGKRSYTRDIDLRLLRSNIPRPPSRPVTNDAVYYADTYGSVFAINPFTNAVEPFAAFSGRIVALLPTRDRALIAESAKGEGYFISSDKTTKVALGPFYEPRLTEGRTHAVAVESRDRSMTRFLIFEIDNRHLYSGAVTAEAGDFTFNGIDEVAYVSGGSIYTARFIKH